MKHTHQQSRPQAITPQGEPANIHAVSTNNSCNANGRRQDEVPRVKHQQPTKPQRRATRKSYISRQYNTLQRRRRKPYIGRQKQHAPKAGNISPALVGTNNTLPKGATQHNMARIQRGNKSKRAGIQRGADSPFQPRWAKQHAQGEQHARGANSEVL